MTTESSTRRSQSGHVADSIVDRIRRGDYTVGSRLPSERKLPEEYGVSRPVIREAISTVSGLGLLEAQVGRGTFVTAQPVRSNTAEPLSLQDVVNVREVLEVGALRLTARCSPTSASHQELRDSVSAALDRLTEAVMAQEATAQLDSELHTAIVAASESPMLLAMWKSIQQQVDATIRLSPHGHTMSTNILDDHRQLARAVTHGEIENGIKACERLHEENRNFLRDLLG